MKSVLKGLLTYPLLEVRIGPGILDSAELKDEEQIYAVIQVKGSRGRSYAGVQLCCNARCQHGKSTEKVKLVFFFLTEHGQQNGDAKKEAQK